MKKQNLSLAMLAVLFLAAAPARAQEATEAAVAEPVGVTVTSSQAAIQVGGSATAARTGLSETVTFSGDVVIHANVVTDPVMPTGVTLFVDCKGIRGISEETRTAYINSCEANVTRLFRPTDKITLTFAFFEEKSDSFLKSKTGVLTINLTYDEKTRTLTSATGAVGTLDWSATTTP